MALKKQVFDDCTNHGLQHAWSVFRDESPDYSTKTISAGSIACGLAFIPVQENPLPVETKIRTHQRRCQNCQRVEDFWEAVSKKWKVTETGVNP